MEHAGGDDNPPPPGEEEEFHKVEDNVPPPPQLNAGTIPFPWPPGMWPPQWPPEWYQAPQQQQHAHEARMDRVKLGPFMQSKHSMWFNLAEASCRRNYVVDVIDKYDVVLSALPDEVIKKLGPIADSPQGPADPYTVLKDCVLQLYAPTVWEDLDSLLHYRESANLRPQHF